MLWHILLILFLATPVIAAERIVAVADVHGAYDPFVEILQKAGVIDAEKNWSAGKTVFVQLGDVPDRGPKTRQAMDLLMKLEQQSGKQGGRVHSLLGNHEVMVMIGDLRYVSPEEYASFADTQSPAKQKEAYRQYVEFRGKRSPQGTQSMPVEPEEEWYKTHPPGFVEHRKAFSPEGVYGKWLRNHDAVTEVDKIIFLHGGLNPEAAANRKDAINRKIREEIATFDRVQKFMIQKGMALPFFTLEEMIGVARTEADLLKAKADSLSSSEKETLLNLESFLELGSWWSVHPSGPLWFRGYAQWSNEEGTAKVDQVLTASGARHVVVGHTPQPDGRISSRFGQKVFMIDTGMLQPYYKNGRASALLYENGKFSALYTDGPQSIQEAVAQPAQEK